MSYQESRIYPARLRLHALTLALAALLPSTSTQADFTPSPPVILAGSEFDGSLANPAVARAYLGAATPDKLAAALAGLRPLLTELPLVTPPGPCWFCWSGTVGVSTDPGVVYPTDLSMGPSPTLLFAGGDADLGPPGATVTLAFTRLQLTGSFATSRDFVIGHPAYDPSYLPGEPIFTLPVITPVVEVIEDSPPAGGPGWIDTNGFDLKITGTVTSHQVLYKEGEGTLWLTGANVWHAVPVVKAGVLMGDTRSLATDILNNGRVSFAQAADGTYAHVLSGTGGLEKTGAGRLLLTRAQTYQGATDLRQGTLSLDASGQLPQGTLLTIDAGATLDISAVEHAARIEGLVGAGEVILGEKRLILVPSGEVPRNFSGVISGTGEVMLSYGGGVQRFTGRNTYSGGTRLLGWNTRLEIAHDASLGAPDGAVHFEGGTLAVLASLATVRKLRIEGLGSLDTNGFDVTLLSGLEGTGTFSKKGEGSLILTTATPFAGLMEVSGGTLAMVGAGNIDPATRLHVGEAIVDLSGADGDRRLLAISGVDTAQVRLGEHTLTLSGGSGTFNGVIGGRGGLTLDGALTLQTLGGANTYTGPTTILAGTLRARPTGLSDRVINHGRLELFESGGPDDISAYSGDISGSGELIKTGQSVIWLRGHNTHTGGTRVEAGVLMGNTASLTGDIETHAGLAFYQVADGSYAGRVSGSGTLMSFGPGALTLTGENTHTGGTAFSNTLRVSRDANLGDPASGLLIAGGTLVALDDLTLNRHVALGQNGARFDGNGHDIRLDGRIDGPGGVTKLGEGVLHLAGTHGYAGPTVVQAGGLMVNGSLAGDVEVWEGAWFQALGSVGGNVNLAAGAGFSAGNSPGTFSIAGDFLARGEILVEIAGPDLYDQILVGGRADLTGATLHFALLPGARPEDARHISFLTAAGGIVGSDRVTYRFSPGLDGLGVVMQGDALLLAPVPEPGTWALLLAGLGLVGLMAARRKA